jgi:predicted enzyme related to lactoylglutathione lyase
MIQGLRTVIYKVPDLEAAKAWYSRVLGIEPYFAEPYYVGFQVGGFELGLDPDMTGASPGGGVAAYWGVPNADEALARLIDCGGRLHAPVQDVGGGIRLATVLDPFGNLFGVIENPHFSTATVR